MSNPYTILISGTSNFGTFATTHTWLPTFLKEIGATKSTSEIKRNRPDLWREIIRDTGGDVVRLGRGVFRIYAVDGIIEVDR